MMTTSILENINAKITRKITKLRGEKEALNGRNKTDKLIAIESEIKACVECRSFVTQALSVGNATSTLKTPSSSIRSRFTERGKTGPA